ncbi:MAG: prepilin-type cleavage/methylation domain-containing protein, partial [Fervidobacterium sp.]
VIAALMAVATPMALNAVKQAKASQVAQNLQNIMTAEENYVNTEQSLPATTVDQLVSKNYLSSTPTNYTIDTKPTPTAWDNGQVKVTIKYNGGDVSVADVKKQNPNVIDGGSGAPALEATVVKWW